MATVRRWVIAGALGCAIVALAYLPPRGAKSGNRQRFFFSAPAGTPARLRAQELADQWRAADAALHLLTLRRALQQRIRAERRSGRSLLVVAESSGVAIPAPLIADSAAHAAWRGLGLGETKVGVALVIQLSTAAPMRDRPLTEDGLATYLAPDSTDRTTCVAMIPAGRYWTRYFTGNLRAERRLPFGALVQSLHAGLGPCAFYAVYGTPSRTVRGWLIARNWDLASHLDAGPRGPQAGSLYGFADQRYSWYWDAIYSLPPPGVACLAGRATGCRAAVLAGASADPVIPVPDIQRLLPRWRRLPNLVEGHRFLGDVARAVGRDRFLTFWTSSSPVDTALAEALKRPVGEWTADWQRDFARPIRLGPMPPLGGLGIALTIGCFAIAIVTLTTSRRQVR